MPPSTFPKFFFLISILSSSIFTHSYIYSQCLNGQKNLLLQLRNELIFDSTISTKLVQWNQTNDCCKWHGVECGGAGNVISLQLDFEAISGGIRDSSTLFLLMHLQKLNLAYNDFNYTPIPRGIHYLTYLTHLNLSNAGFGGQITAEMLSLKRLVSLDISNNLVSLDYPNLEMLLSNMTSLRDLYLDGVNITSSDERRKWSHIIPSYLPNITSLSLVDCSLSGPLATSFWQLHSLSIIRLDYNDLSTLVPDLFANFSNLTTLSLVHCGLKGSFPGMIFQIHTLQNLDLTSNPLLSGSIPPFTQTGSLESIVLAGTNFSGSIPSSISSLKSLSKIDLSNCKFTGSIPFTFANLTQLTYVDLGFNLFTGSLPSTLFQGISSLFYLSLGYNSFTGHIPRSLFCLPSLSILHLGSNQFTGEVEEFSNANLSNIYSLDLSSNRLEGHIPDSFFQLHRLDSLWLEENLFRGSFQLNKIQSLVNLQFLDLAYNNLSVDIGNRNASMYELPNLKYLYLASCNLYDFPDFIKHSDMIELDLSNNRIGGEIPSWIWGSQIQFLNLSLNLLTDLQKPYHISTSLQIMDLRSNQLGGEIHLPTPHNLIASGLRYLLLSNNKFSGSISTSLCTATKLDVLDFSVNKLSGSIPFCLLDHTMSLSVLALGRNNVSGRIPDNFSLDCTLEYFDLYNNTLEGEIPKSLENCKSLEFLNVGKNIINDTFPCMLPSSLRVLVLRSNRFHGEVNCERSWPDLQILDISSNNFTGSLESINFSGWRAMIALRSEAQLSFNPYGPNYVYYYPGFRFIMKGLDVDIVKIWTEFTAIDFSGNNFRGEIADAISDLSSLHLLNLSHNSLNGSIPKSFGMMGKLESLDLSRNQLAGLIPKQLAELTFLSVLNLSYNNLVGKIPNGRQLQTFSADSFKGNPGLCGFNLNISCNRTEDDSDLSPSESENAEEREIEGEYVSAALGYVVGLGSFVWLLLFCRSFRYKYFGKIDEVVDEIFDARNRRRRRRRRATKIVRNQVRRSQ